MSEKKDPPEAKTYTQEEFDAIEQKMYDEKARAADALKRADDLEKKTVKELRAEIDRLKGEKALNTPEDLEAWKKDMEKSIRAAVQSDVDSLKAKAESSGKALKEFQIVDKTFSKIAEKFHKDNHDIVKDMIRKSGDLDEKGNVIFKDENGNPIYAKGSTTEFADAEFIAASILEKRPSWAANTTNNGTASPGQFKGNNNGDSKIKIPDSPLEAKAMTAEQFKKFCMEVSEADANKVLALRLGLPTQ